MDINTLKEYPLIDETIEKLTKRLNNIIIRKDDTSDTLKSAKSRLDAIQRTETGNTVLSAIEKIIDNFDEEIKDIEYQISKWILIQRDIRNRVYEPGVLTKDERKIIEIAYFDEANWKLIPNIMRCGKTRCYELKESALNKIGIKIINKVSA